MEKEETLSLPRERTKEYRPRILKIGEEKKKRALLRKHLTWPRLRLACISLGAKAECTQCGEGNVLPSHIISHAGEDKDIFNTIFGLIRTEQSISNLAELEEETLKKCWLFYKKTFKFKPKLKMNTTNNLN